MGKLVVDGAKLSCNQGTSTCTLTVLATRSTDRDSTPLASVQDYKMPNISGVRASDAGEPAGRVCDRVCARRTDAAAVLTGHYVGMVARIVRRHDEG